jgi:flagellar hook assembly protein FlgD
VQRDSTFVPRKTLKQITMSTKAFFFSLILSVSSTLAFATIDESSMVIVAGEHASVFKVIYKSASANKVQITISNSNNDIVFTESFNKKSEFTRPYNFNGLPEGEYTIEVKDNFGRKIEKVNYSLGTVKSIIKVSKMSNEKAKYMLTVANKGTNVINVSIFNEAGDQLLDTAHVANGDFGIVYNLVEAGAYTFIVSDKSGNSRTIQF